MRKEVVYHWKLFETYSIPKKDIVGGDRFSYELLVRDDNGCFTFVTVREDRSKLTKYGDKRRQFQRIDIPKSKMRHLINFLIRRMGA